MEDVPGQRLRSHIYFHGVEPYHLDNRCKDLPYKYYRCASRTTETQCDVSVCVSELEVATRYGTHNHPTDPNIKNDCLFRQEIKRLARDILPTPAEVLRQACQQLVAIPFTLNFISM